MDKQLQVIIDVLTDKLKMCVIQCSVENCPNVTIDGFSNHEKYIMTNCESCNNDLCWDHIHDGLCQECSSKYWEDRCKELETQFKTQQFLMGEICDLTDTTVYSCYDQTCNKKYINSGKANQSFELDGIKVSDDGFFICNHCGEGYCTTHYNMLIPSIDNPELQKCPICGNQDEIRSKIESPEYKIA